MNSFSPINFNAGFSNQNLSIERESVSSNHGIGFSDLFKAVDSIDVIPKSNQSETANFLNQAVKSPYKEQFKVRTGYDAVFDLEKFLNELMKKQNGKE